MAHFSKRHYEAIALVMQNSHPNCKLGHPNHLPLLDQWSFDVHNLADMFRNDNPLFDRSRFIHACKPGSNVKAKTAHLKVA